MTTDTKLAVTTPSNTEVILSRTFDAPRDLVFQAHSSCERAARWWGRGNPLDCEMDFRVGGAYRFVEHAPDGKDYAFRGEYREIDVPSRIVQTFEFEGMPGHVLVETLVFEERDGRTTITSTSQFSSQEDRDNMINSGMAVGAAESYDKLAELLPSWA